MAKQAYCGFDGENIATHQVLQNKRWVYACKWCARDSKNAGGKIRQVFKMMTIEQVRKAIKTADRIMVATNISGTGTLYVKPDKQDLIMALKHLKKYGYKKIKSTLAQPSNILYIGE